MSKKTPKTIDHLKAMLEWAKGNRGRKDINPYAVPEVKAALQHLAKLQGLPEGHNSEYLDAKTNDGAC